jgi:hypothetical protein
MIEGEGDGLLAGPDGVGGGPEVGGDEEAQAGARGDRTLPEQAVADLHEGRGERARGEQEEHVLLAGRARDGESGAGIRRKAYGPIRAEGWVLPRLRGPDRLPGAAGAVVEPSSTTTSSSLLQCSQQGGVTVDSSTSRCSGSGLRPVGRRGFLGGFTFGGMNGGLGRSSGATVAEVGGGFGVGGAVGLRLRFAAAANSAIRSLPAATTSVSRPIMSAISAICASERFACSRSAVSSARLAASSANASASAFLRRWFSTSRGSAGTGGMATIPARNGDVVNTRPRKRSF